MRRMYRGVRTVGTRFLRASGGCKNLRGPTLTRIPRVWTAATGYPFTDMLLIGDRSFCARPSLFDLDA